MGIGEELKGEELGDTEYCSIENSRKKHTQT